MTLPTALNAASAAVAGRLTAALADLPASRVRDAMAHALVGGKGLRGFLVLHGCALHGVAPEAALNAAAAIEAMHAYSLVHDDLPAMDDDALRRGQPTVHVKWDEATAILAGDALQTLAFELLCDPVLGAARIPLIHGLARASGAQGMVLGQALDIAAETAAIPLTLPEIIRLQAGKTGALITWAAEAGAHLAAADPAPLRAYATALGLAFQIADDILDVTGDASKTGKAVGKDANAGKATFVSLLGLAGAQNRAAELVAEAEAHLCCYGNAAGNLIAAAHFTISRQN